MIRKFLRLFDLKRFPPDSAAARIQAFVIAALVTAVLYELGVFK